ncbi:hypothetical protein ACQ4PT_065324 [Festuca glaucescens]
MSSGIEGDNEVVFDDDQVGLEDVDMSSSEDEDEVSDNDNTIFDGAGSEADNMHIDGENSNMDIDDKPNSENDTDVIEAYLGDLRIKVADDRILCPAWRENSIVEKPPVRGRRKKQTAQKMSTHEKSACYGRCVDEYFATNKAFFTVNINKCHWITVLTHSIKMEFQVLDSLFNLRHNNKFMEKLRAEIAKDVAYANKDISYLKFPDVLKWPIKSYDIAKQKDGNSCGLFVLQCMEHWDGDEMKGKVLQEIVDNSRGRIVAEVVMASTNLNAKVQKTVLDIVVMAQALKHNHQYIMDWK